MAEPIAPVFRRLATTAERPTPSGPLTVPERVTAWFATASPLGAAGTVHAIDLGDGSLGESDLDDHRDAWQGSFDGLLDLLSGGA